MQAWHTGPARRNGREPGERADGEALSSSAHGAGRLAFDSPRPVVRPIPAEGERVMVDPVEVLVVLAAVPSLLALALNVYVFVIRRRGEAASRALSEAVGW